ncbi:MAG: ABC transporter permease [Salinivirgaceae bacterium]|nr:ABC transporter permease [Salinivirgaceae bacterium]
MRKILTIIEREYLTRVKNKSFIIMSILGPILFAALLIAPTLLMNANNTEIKIVQVVDSTHVFRNQLPETDYIKFVYMPDANLQKYKSEFSQSGFYALLYISHNVVNSDNSVYLYSDRTANLDLRMHISNSIEKRLENEKLRACGVDPGILSAVKTRININTIKLTDDGHEERDNMTLKMVLSFLMGVLIYMSIFLSGNAVMRGVIEEKTNRIVEVIVSSVKPVQLMAGKIIGVGLVTLTQFALWAVLTFSIYSAVAPMLMPDTAAIEAAAPQSLFSQGGSQLAQSQPDNTEMSQDFKEMFSTIDSINFPVIILSFIFFFLFGYLLYGALFAAVGAMVDNEADTQQFVLPLSAPLLLSIIALTGTISSPDSQLNFWLSIIPFTSPVTMLSRIPYGVPYSEIFLSALLLIATFVLCTLIAGKIYRTGILMYGKKPTMKELWRWIKIR